MSSILDKILGFSDQVLVSEERTANESSLGCAESETPPAAQNVITHTFPSSIILVHDDGTVTYHDPLDGHVVAERFADGSYKIYGRDLSVTYVAEDGSIIGYETRGMHELTPSAHYFDFSDQPLIIKGRRQRTKHHDEAAVALENTTKRFAENPPVISTASLPEEDVQREVQEVARVERTSETSDHGDALPPSVAAGFTSEERSSGSVSIVIQETQTVLPLDMSLATHEGEAAPTFSSVAFQGMEISAFLFQRAQRETPLERGVSSLQHQLPFFQPTENVAILSFSFGHFENVPIIAGGRLLMEDHVTRGSYDDDEHPLSDEISMREGGLGIDEMLTAFALGGSHSQSAQNIVSRSSTKVTQDGDVLRLRDSVDSVAVYDIDMRKGDHSAPTATFIFANQYMQQGDGALVLGGDIRSNSGYHIDRTASRGDPSEERRNSSSSHDQAFQGREDGSAEYAELTEDLLEEDPNSKTS